MIAVLTIRAFIAGLIEPRWMLVATHLLVLGCSGHTDVVRTVSPHDAHELLRQDRAVLVDVREEPEIRNGMAEGARWMATTKVADSEAWTAFVASLPREKEVLFYCAIGGRAETAAQKLAQEGFRTGNVGGFQEWKDAGLPWRRPADPGRREEPDAR